ncbi:MAG: SUMF1/EgtB/PvdO family nonheme iron enzyme [Planctomycetes bacterium]|nr:SUMF1/EgtB/PvdO family nonheme iron enzyme [Planctomycetota bacterium]
MSSTDGAIMVYVPSGEFIMGLDAAEAETVARDLGFKDAEPLWAWEAAPRHQRKLPGYFIDQTEVTVGQWHRFVQASGLQSRSEETARHFGKPAEEFLPAGGVPWEEAKQYAAWAGKALPTEAQWEKAARGADGRLYPWGNDPPTPEHGHFGLRNAQRALHGIGVKLYTWVGRYPKGASPYGALDMLGNQYEWTSEWFQAYPGNPMADRMKDYPAKFICLRGGSWYHGWVGFYAAKRFGFEPGETYYHVGFRTVWTPPAGYLGSEEFGQARAALEATKALRAERVRVAEAAETGP